MLNHGTTSDDIRHITPEALAALGAPHMVYVRPVKAAELADISGVPKNAELYAVHAADGTRMAVLTSRDAAFYIARENDMQPVSVH
jgi:hypothetical protein